MSANSKIEWTDIRDAPEDEDGRTLGMKTLDELAEEQGITPQNIQKIISMAKGLWENEEDLEAFLEDLKALRRR